MQCENLRVVWHNNVMHQVPCGKCLICLSTKRKDWIFRLKQEWKASRGECMFVTLTYAPRYCPDQLSKLHLQLFFKRLRKHEKGKRIRYFAVGEYGGQFGRPHYHIILFNADLSGDKVRRAWTVDHGKNSIGLVHIGKVTEASIAYCTKYVVQPMEKVGKGVVRPFALMSRGYGIGAAYLTDEMVEWHRRGSRNYTMLRGVKSRLPRFYKDKIWHREDDRKRIGSKAKWDAIREHRENLRLYKRLYGKDAKAKMKEFRDAYLSQIKTKVAFTQHLM